MFERYYKLVAAIMVVAITAVVFQNCSSGFEVSRDLSSRQPLSPVQEVIDISLEGIPELFNKSLIEADFEVTGTSSIASVSCQIGSGGAQDCSSKKLSYNSTADGDYNLEVSVITLSGQKASKRKNIRVDTTAPVITVTTAPTATTTQTTANFVFSVSDNLSGVAAVKCSLDNVNFSECISPVNLTNLSLAAHNFRIQATDVAGNSSAIYSHNWTVQDPAPTVSSVAITTTLPSITKSSSVSIAFTGVNVTGYRCQLDGATATACTSPQTYSSLSSGPHAFSVQGTRADDSLTTAATASFTVDTIAPTLPMIMSSEPAATTATSVTFNFTSTDNVAIASYQCSLDSATYTNCTSPKTYSNLTIGNHVFSVRAVDIAGNVSTPAANYNWAISPPVVSCKNYATLTWTIPSTNADGTTLNTTELGGYKIYYGTSSKNYGTTIDVKSGVQNTYRVENLSPGTYYFALKAYKTGGVESQYSNEAVLNLPTCSASAEVNLSTGKIVVLNATSGQKFFDLSGAQL